ncbi:RDD family protein [Phycisphaerales bacterium AB-hyl4]|uniref:RDD family protein n=1 Tax=Natronomicrosphaera hydrolytica TaxID=3242702 RepID=A0ABV4U8M2_9BACT
MNDREELAQPAAEPGTFVRCDVTGEELPIDETVVLHGYRVGPAGKQTLMQRMEAGEALPGELVRPTVLRRFGCMFVDGILMYIVAIVIMIPVFVMAGLGMADIFTDEYQNPGEIIITGVATLLTTTAGVLYFTLMHGYYGQSVGKMAGRVKLVNEDGNPISMKQAFWRAMIYTGINYLPALAMLAAMVHAMVAEAASMALNLAVAAFFIVNVIFALLDRQQQRAVHDRLTGTRVVRIE